MRSALNFVTAETVDTVLDTALNRKTEAVATLIGDIPEEVKAKHRGNAIRQ